MMWHTRGVSHRMFGFAVMFEALGISLSALIFSGGLLYLTLGTVVGLIFGIIPGLGGPTALALLIPLTFGIDTTAAMFLAGGIMGAIPFGGSVTAILLNTPGTAPNAATVYDGYPMTRKGEAGAALGAAATASSLGGLFGILILFMVLPIAREIILLFSPPEFFMLAVLGLCAIAVSTDGKMLKGLIAACFGLMIAFVGYDNVSGDVRFAFGIDYLWDGIPLIPALVGLFAIAQIVSLYLAGGSISENPAAVRVSRVTDGVRAVFQATFDKALQAESVLQWISDTGIVFDPMSGEELSALISEQTELLMKYKDVLSAK